MFFSPNVWSYPKFPLLLGPNRSPIIYSNPCRSPTRLEGYSLHTNKNTSNKGFVYSTAQLPLFSPTFRPKTVFKLDYVECCYLSFGGSFRRWDLVPSPGLLRPRPRRPVVVDKRQFVARLLDYLWKTHLVLQSRGRDVSVNRSHLRLICPALHYTVVVV